MNSVICALSIGLLIFISPGIGQADSTDSQYLALLASHGVSGQPDQLIAAGHQACEVNVLANAGGLAYGYIAAVNNLDGTLTALGFNPAQKKQLQADASRTYCPEFTPPQ